MEKPLEKLVVLFLDCQTTGSSPVKGHIIDIGWARSDILSSTDMCLTGIESYIVKLPDGEEIPKHVQSVTGISMEDVFTGNPGCDVWNRLLAHAEGVCRINQMEKCPTIIHFSKFEEPFLYNLHKQNNPACAFPLFTICTHEIARRLFPGLPRRGIRAIAGYFGYAVGEYRRSHNHVAATAFIWREMVKILKDANGITTLSQLQKWLDSTAVCVRAERVYPMDTRARLDLPDRPGVYRMLRSNGDVLYIGKTGSLKKRVNSYFRKRTQHPEHILEMLSQAKQLDVTETGSALEAALLESDEIKMHSPPYNVALRKGEREVWFCSYDLQKFNNAPDQKCRIGPFVSQELLKRLAGVAQIIRIHDTSQADEEILITGFGIPHQYAPELECIRSGFDIFLDKHKQNLYAEPVEYALAKLGKVLWLQKLQEKQDVDDDSCDDDTDQEGHTWSPESVSNLIESNILRATHAIRRARWLVWLTESTLAWEEAVSAKSYKVLLVFEKGKMIDREWMDDEKPVPVPPGYKRTFNERQGSLDLMTIDRMRVVTTEIRKIVSTNKWIELCFSPDIMLNRDKLAMILKWI